jgi:hypothetical protein
MLCFVLILKFIFLWLDLSSFLSLFQALFQRILVFFMFKICIFLITSLLLYIPYSFFLLEYDYFQALSSKIRFLLFFPFKPITQFYY